MKTSNRQQPCVLGLGLRLLPYCDVPDLPHPANHGGVRVSLHSSSYPPSTPLWLGGFPLTLSLPCWLQEFFSAICIFSCKTYAVFQVCFVGAKLFLPSCRRKATTNTCHSFGGQYPSRSLGAARSQCQPVFLCLLSPSPGENTGLPVPRGVCFRACHLLTGTKT